MASANRFNDQAREWARISGQLDLIETKAAVARGTLPLPAWDIPAEQSQRIAEDVAFDLARIALE